MKFCWSTIIVKDMEESLKFYHEIVGLEIDRRFSPGPGREIVFLGSGETKVELIWDSSRKGDSDIGKDISLGFETDSVEKLIGLLKEKGISVQEGPNQPNPNIKFFYILDPNGLRVQFVENIR